MELWKPCVSNDNYEVSNLGNVRRVTPSKGARPGKVLRFGFRKDGRLLVVLSSGSKKTTKLVHRLVAEAWLPDFDLVRQVAHNNGNPSDNRIENLRMATSVENMADTLIHGTRSLGSKRPLAKLTEDQIESIRQDQRLHRLIAADYGVSRQLIDGIKSGKRWTHV